MSRPITVIVLIVVLSVFALIQNPSIAHDVSDTIVFSILGLLLSGLGYYLIDFLTPGHLGKSIKEDHNISAAIVVAASMLATAIIIASVMLS